MKIRSIDRLVPAGNQKSVLRSESGIAMVVVMVVILVLGALAGGFAYSMKVETKLAKNTSSDGEIEWIGRSGVELAKYVLGQQLSLSPGFTSLNQKWAGGVGNTNDLLAWVTLDNNRMGNGVFSVKIVDAERRMNINLASQEMLQHAMGLLGADVRDASSIVDAILDWRDPDDQSRLSGAESDDFYLRQKTPYFAKNGPFGEPAELLLVKGVTPEMFFGGSGSGDPGVGIRGAATGRSPMTPGGQGALAGIGLVELFTTFGGPLMNINTATAEALQLIPGIDEFMARSIIQGRAGLDGTEGTEDDIPFVNVGEVNRLLNLPPTFVNQLTRFCQVHSHTFEVSVDVQMDRYKRRYKAWLRRVSPTDVQTLFLYWD